MNEAQISNQLLFVDNLKLVKKEDPVTDHGLNKESINDELLRTLINYSSDIITILSETGIILYESKSIEKILGYSMDELIGMNVFTLIHKEDLKRVYSAFQDGVNNPGKTISIIFRFLKADGTYCYLESVAAKFGSFPHSDKIVVNSRDISERIKAETKIHKLSTAVEQSSNTVVITDIDGNIEYVNKAFEVLTGYSKDDIIGKNTYLFNSGQTSQTVYKEMWTNILTGKTWEGDLCNRKKNGELYWEEIKITPVVDNNDRIINFIAIKNDITEKKHHEEQLQKALKEKEVMLKEIHHRVKNNLQIVVSLLNLQATSVDDPMLKSQLTISQNRVRSMALIHQLLYNSNDLGSINMEEYLLSIAGYLSASYGELTNKVKIKVNAANIQFTIDTAVPFGLLVNELVTNSFKHAFPDKKHGEIVIDLKKTDDNNYILKYHDNGVGVPFTLVNGHVTSIGLYLVELLVSQLEGTIEHIQSKGTTYNIKFQETSYTPRFS
ncbi:MAG: PAS domain S-box protein [Ignavibacteria bacterium]|nr:PAS domain S-box protein [Ignavibacteria bacterium]